MNQNTYDIVIIGGGIMGSACAYYLMNADDKLKVAVIEMDPAYERSSSTLSCSNARIQFSLRKNVQISQYALDILQNFEDEMTVNEDRPNITYHREGNLFLVDKAGRSVSEEAFELQKGLGCDIEWWSTDKIKNAYPLYEPAGLEGGTFGSQDGHFDAYAVLMAYKKKARSLGAEYIHDEVTEIVTDSGCATGVRTVSDKNLTSKYVINCAGAWATRIAKTAGVHLPIDPVKRQIFVLDTTIKPDGPLPLTVLPSGLFFRTETGGLILLGKSMEEDAVGFDFNWDNQRFMEILWPELAEFVPAFDTAKLLRGWAGLYAVNRIDGNAILGEWPELAGLFLANGFSGHGLQQGPAVGRYITELILDKPPVLDLSIFSPERILENRPLCEGGLV